MVTTRKSRPAKLQALTAQRAARLCKLLRLLRTGPQTRAALTRRLALDVRGFYRDLEWLRKFGISVVMADGRYRLDEDAEKAIARLPLPDPQLTLGEASQLAKGRTAAHRKLKGLVGAILS
jgi:predicted DNA-binding transcriptional regulator YafY